MLGQCLLEHLAVAVVVLDGSDLGDATEALKGAQVRLVDMCKVGVRNDDVGQRLDVAQAVGKPTLLEAIAGACSRAVPGGQLEAAVVGRVDEPRLVECPAKEGQLAQTDGSGLSLDPTTTGSVERPVMACAVQAYSSRADDGRHVGATAAAWALLRGTARRKADSGALRPGPYRWRRAPKPAWHVLMAVEA
jgi:hypothetical protein